MLAEALGDPSLELLFWLPDERLTRRLRRASVAEAPGTRRAPHAGAPRQPSARAPSSTTARSANGPDLLESVIDAAGLAIEIARLRVEVRRQLAEVEESRERIVTAGYEERRRLERDLHDGAQQRLVSIGLALRHIQGQLPRRGRAGARSLDATVGEVGAGDRRAARAGPRRPSRRPRRRAGGRAAGARLALALRTKVEATEERFEDRVETAAYFVASEALANAAKHAQASSVRSRAARQRQPGGLASATTASAARVPPRGRVSPA